MKLPPFKHPERGGRSVQPEGPECELLKAQDGRRSKAQRRRGSLLLPGERDWLHWRKRDGLKQRRRGRAGCDSWGLGWAVSPGFSRANCSTDLSISTEPEGRPKLPLRRLEKSHLLATRRRCHLSRVSGCTMMITSPNNLPSGLPFSASTLRWASWRRQCGECRSSRAR